MGRPKAVYQTGETVCVKGVEFGAVSKAVYVCACVCTE